MPPIAIKISITIQLTKRLFIQIQKKQVISCLFIGKHTPGYLINSLDRTPKIKAINPKVKIYLDLVLANRFFILNQLFNNDILIILRIKHFDAIKLNILIKNLILQKDNNRV